MEILLMWDLAEQLPDLSVYPTQSHSGYHYSWSAVLLQLWGLALIKLQICIKCLLVVWLKWK